ncbi:hypothetical protein BDV96DRAFT_604487 [Lophiotrema nucula]|uniref:P-loop containing nucleoside triphosphate hydrolase protein n=1 Tax=Lophiotrema nucula TaxID=690887 RepID=A0A6A5YQR5_9PLEO|nr:hypothetical protein BDV96DRAFT_604487 [Lophiotrema nucula]
MHQPHVRFLVACPRSGSTLLMRIFAEAPGCAVTSRLLLMGKHGKGKGFTPDYTILESPLAVRSYQQAIEAGSELLINKEELGDDRNKGECTYEIFSTLSDRSETAHKMVKPVFLIRDPIRVFDSRKNVGWTDIDTIVACFNNLFRMQGEGQEESYWLIYEKLVRYKCDEIERVCKHWGIAYAPGMLEFRKGFGSFTFNSERERRIYQEKKPLGLFNTVEARPLRPTYPHMDYCRTTKTNKTSSAFIEGKTSHEYREERFRAVLQHFSRDVSEKDMERFLATYEETLTKALELKCGALDLFDTLRAMGKKIAVITEGPQDAQERTMQALGIADKVEFLATTNAFGLS